MQYPVSHKHDISLRLGMQFESLRIMEACHVVMVEVREKKMFAQKIEKNM